MLYFELGIGVFKSPIQILKKKKSPIQNHHLVVISPIGDFNFYFSNGIMGLWSLGNCGMGELGAWGLGNWGIG